MDADHKIGNEDALAMIYSRNAFYRAKYRLILGVSAIGLLLIITLMGVLVYLVKHPPHPLYFATDDAGRFIQQIPGQQPNMTTPEVAIWVTQAVEAAYSYDFINYRLQLQNAQKYFTDYGWHQYMRGLEASNNLLALAQRKFVVIAKVVNTPKLIAEGPLGKSGTYAWKFEMPVLVTYLTPPYDDKSKFENPLIVTVVVSRQDILASYKGLGIVQMIGTLTQ